MQPFSVTFHEVQSFTNGTIFLACENTEAIKSIMKKIFEAFPECKPYNGQFNAPTPHVTIAKIPDQKKFTELYNEIVTAIKPKLPITYQINEIVIMEELETKNWTIIQKINL